MKVTPTAAKAVRHADGCPQDRLESFAAVGPAGRVVVTRCMDCGAQDPDSPAGSAAAAAAKNSNTLRAV